MTINFHLFHRHIIYHLGLETFFYRVKKHFWFLSFHGSNNLVSKLLEIFSL